MFKDFPNLLDSGNKKEIKKLNKEKENLESLDKEIADVQDNIAMLNCCMDDETIEKTDALLLYSKIGNKANFNTNNISDENIIDSINNVEELIGDYIVSSMGETLYNEKTKYTTSQNLIEEINTKIYDFQNLKDNEINEIDKKINHYNNN